MYIAGIFSWLHWKIWTTMYIYTEYFMTTLKNLNHEVYIHCIFHDYTEKSEPQCIYTLYISWLHWKSWTTMYIYTVYFMTTLKNLNHNVYIHCIFHDYTEKAELKCIYTLYISWLHWNLSELVCIFCYSEITVLLIIWHRRTIAKKKVDRPYWDIFLNLGHCMDVCGVQPVCTFQTHQVFGSSWHFLTCWTRNWHTWTGWSMFVYIAMSVVKHTNKENLINIGYFYYQFAISLLI